MQPETPLLRQVHPQWFKDGHVASLAFRPFPKDEGLLSVYDGSQIGPKSSWERYTKVLGFKSAGVWVVTVAETTACDLPARPDPLKDFPEHAVIDFTHHPRKQQEAKSKVLAARAEERGCLFVAPA